MEDTKRPKGTCEIHGEFTLADGCLGCLRDEARKSEAVEGLTLKPDKPTDFTEPVVVTLTLTDPNSDALVVAFWKQAFGLLRHATDLNIVKVEDLKLATDGLSVISKLKKAVGEKQKEYLQPFKEHIAEVNEAFKRLMEPILAADSLTREKVAAYYAEQARIRREQEEVNRLRMEAAEKEMALKSELSESVNLVEVTSEPAKAVQTDMGTSGMAKIWKFEVIDFSLLPDRFKMENATLIGKVVRAGEREIPGVKVWSEDSLRVTARYQRLKKEVEL